jgi:hypothetical protein
MRRLLLSLFLVAACKQAEYPNNPTNAEMTPQGCWANIYRAADEVIIDPLADAADYCNWLACVNDDDRDDPRRCPAFRKQDCHAVSSTARYHARVMCYWRTGRVGWP